MPDDALDEALSALRVLGDPSRAWGVGRARADNMQVFANAARQRVIRLRDREERCPVCGSDDPNVEGITSAGRSLTDPICRDPFHDPPSSPELFRSTDA